MSTIMLCRIRANRSFTDLIWLFYEIGEPTAGMGLQEECVACSSQWMRSLDADQVVVVEKP
jgi:hypothetical protein